MSKPRCRECSEVLRFYESYGGNRTCLRCEVKTLSAKRMWQMPLYGQNPLPNGQVDDRLKSETMPISGQK